MDLRFFTDLKVGYYISSVLGAVLLFGFLSLLEVSIFITIPIMLLWIFLCSIVCTVISGKRVDKKVNEFHNNCNVTEFLDFNIEISNELRKPDNSVNINLATAYFYLGNFETAYNILEIVKLKPSSNTVNAVTGISYYRLLFVLCLKLDKREEAERALDSILEISKMPFVKYPYTETFKLYYHVCSMDYNVKYNDLILNEEYYLNDIKAQNITISKVVSIFEIAEFYYKNEQYDKSKNAYNFVIQNGGNTFYVAIAKEKLKILNEM